MCVNKLNAVHDAAQLAGLQGSIVLVFAMPVDWTHVSPELSSLAHPQVKYISTVLQTFHVKAQPSYHFIQACQCISWQPFYRLGEGKAKGSAAGWPQRSCEDICQTHW